MVSRHSDLQAMEAYFDALLSEPEFEHSSTGADIDRTPNPCNLSLSLAEQQLEHPVPASEPLKLKPLQQLLEEVSFEPQPEPPEPQALVTHLPSVATTIEVQAEASPSKPLVEPQVEPKSKIEVQENAIATPGLELMAQNQAELTADWENIATADEFQVLFFVVAGVTFAVPLTELGGINKVAKLTPLFGKPAWYSGLFYEQEQAVNVVDTACWIMPEKQYNPEYKYYIMLGDSGWGLSAEKLIGTELLDKNSVLWRTQAGKRPWLAGMIKEKMCALLHVSELVKLLELGIDISGNYD